MTVPLPDTDIPTPFRSRISAPQWTRTPAPPDPLAQTGEYSIFGLTRGVPQAVVRERQVGFTLIVFAVATAIGALYSVEQYVYNRLTGEPTPLVRIVPTDLIFTYTWAVLAPLVLFGARRFPVWGGGQWRPRNWVVQFGAMVAFIGAHAFLLSAANVALHTHYTLAMLPRLFGDSLVSWTILDAVVFCALITMHHAVIYYRVSKDRAIRASQLEARLAQTQLQMLRMQLQPHFLFNTLHSISALMHKDVRRADSMVVALSDLLRMSLQNIGAQEVALQSELDFLQRYLEIMSMRFGDRLKVSIDVDPETRDARVPNLFLQPLVENSFKHGFGDLGKGAIAITVKRDGDMLRCDVVDDGRGLKTAHREGVGLTSTRQRLAHLYGDRHTFQIRAGETGGVHVTLAVPFHHFGRTAAS